MAALFKMLQMLPLVVDDVSTTGSKLVVDVSKTE